MVPLISDYRRDLLKQYPILGNMVDDKKEPG